MLKGFFNRSGNFVTHACTNLFSCKSPPLTNIIPQMKGGKTHSAVGWSRYLSGEWLCGHAFLSFEAIYLILDYSFTLAIENKARCAHRYRCLNCLAIWLSYLSIFRVEYSAEEQQTNLGDSRKCFLICPLLLETHYFILKLGVNFGDLLHSYNSYELAR